MATDTTDTFHYHVHHMSLGCVVGDGPLATFDSEKEANDYVESEARDIKASTPGARMTGPRGDRTVSWGIAGEAHIYTEGCFEPDCQGEEGIVI